MTILGGLIGRAGLVALGAGASPNAVFDDTYEEYSNIILTSGSSSTQLFGNNYVQLGTVTALHWRLASSITIEKISVHLQINSRNGTGADFSLHSSETSDDSGHSTTDEMINFVALQTGIISASPDVSISFSKGSGESKWGFIISQNWGSSGSIEGQLNTGVRHQ